MLDSDYLIEGSAHAAPTETDLREAILLLIDKIEGLACSTPVCLSTGKANAGVSASNYPIEASEEYRRRRFRKLAFDGFCFDREPAWDILLDLLANSHRGGLHTTSVCIGSSVPHTTALRYIELLEAAGLVLSERCSRDRRVRTLRLTQKALAGFERYFTATRRT